MRKFKYKKKGYTHRRAERKCLENKNCNFSEQMAWKKMV